MTNQSMHLKKIIELEKWQTLQDSLATITKMAIITVDYKGIPVTKHSSCTPFCVQIRTDPELFQHCKKCDARGGLEAVRLNAPYIYYCHCHIIDLAIPITVNDKYIGAVMAGQVRLAPTDDVDLEQILTVTGKTYERKRSALAHLYYKMPILSFQEVQIIAEMLHRLANYIVEEAVTKNTLLAEYRPTTSPSSEPRHKLSSTLLNSHVKSDLLLTDQTYTNNSTLRPIFNYINENKSENIPLTKAAALCHISTSHFSRLFAKETGANYSNFLTQLKINWSKQLLGETTLSIRQISEELGYNDTGYFIKTFKKYEGVTPLLYRKYYTQM